MGKGNFIFCCAAIALLFSTFENLNAQWQTSGNNIYYSDGHVGIGTASIDNNHEWHKVLDIYASAHSKLMVRSANVKTGIFSHETWSGTVGRIGTESAHDLRLMAGYGNDVMTMKTNGNVGIGTTNPTSKLTVAGNISAREILVDANAGADFVFAPEYRLRPLSEVETFIKDNRHLPDIAPADSMVQNGIDVSEMQIKLLQKIEELTLYVIEQEKRIKELEKQEN